MSIEFLKRLEEIIDERVRSRSEQSYTYRLYSQGIERVCKKLLEEAGEVVIAALREGRDRFIQEVADLIYHLLVLMYMMNVKLEDVCRELEARHLSKVSAQTSR